MSIATLKKKSQAKNNPHSVGRDGFSLNGTHRSQGYVGQTMLSRSLPRTLMNGNVMRGNGGCCGKYYIGPIVQSAVNSQEDPNVVKSSVTGTSGMISTKYRWIDRPMPYATVKPDDYKNINDQSTYLANLNRQTVNNVNSCNNANGKKPVAECKPTCQFVSTSNYNVTSNIPPITKQMSDYTPISQGEYLLNLEKKCAIMDVSFNLLSAKRINRTPLPGN